MSSLAHAIEYMGYRLDTDYRATERYRTPRKVTCSECGELLGWYYDKAAHAAAEGAGVCDTCVRQAEAYAQRLIVRLSWVIASMARDHGETHVKAKYRLKHSDYVRVRDSRYGHFDPSNAHVAVARAIGLNTLADNITKAWTVMRSGSWTRSGCIAKKQSR